MRRILRLREKIRSTARHGADGKPLRAPTSRDPELVAIAEIARRRRLDAERSLEAAFEKARPILRRMTVSSRPIQISNLPADIEARVRAMPDPEQRIRAIVEFKLSTRIQSSHPTKPSEQTMFTSWNDVRIGRSLRSDLRRVKRASNLRNLWPL